MRLLLLLSLIVLAGCSSNPHKAKELNTQMDTKTMISGNTAIGVKDGNMIVQKKVLMAETLRSLQNSVYGLEDRVYGNRKYGSEGLYGALKKCRRERISKKNGGNGKLVWTEPMDRITDKEDQFEIGLNDKNKLIGLKEEFLKDRIVRFKKYKETLITREDEYKEKLEVCDARLNAQLHDQKSK